ncbi:hypothetical protein DCAR_0312122 [Daucus carota subsp. sativus]|uniref:Uncharacterized protein n=1 Tax=Daucus carota subsp. sativus TaxID=79200 RepID=A0A162AJC7_DAUCS|nr:hypothetical protein DCAR_0312122 [Daucus carota subsp. sativus]
MESTAFAGIAVKDVLNKAVLGKLAELLPLWSMTKSEMDESSGDGGFMSVYNVMKLMGYGNQDAENKYYASRASTSAQRRV